MTVDVQIKWDRSKTLRDVGERKERGIKVASSEFRRYADPYVMYRSGATANSAYTASRLEEGLVIYDTPYASFAYNMDPDTTNVTRVKHPNAQTHWGEPVLDRHMDAILATMKKEMFR